MAGCYDLSMLRQRRFERGITVTVSCKDLAREPYEDTWTINPLLYEGETITGYKGMNDLVEAAERIADELRTLTQLGAETRAGERRPGIPAPGRAPAGQCSGVGEWLTTAGGLGRGTAA